MSAGDTRQKRIVFGRAEWIGLAFFLGVGLLALPFLRDALEIQGIWLAFCAAIGVAG